MPVNFNLDFPAQNKQRRYPLAVDATLTDATGTFTIPMDFLVELRLPVHAGMDVDPGRFFVVSIGAYPSGYTVMVAYQPREGPAVNVATVIVPTAGFVRNTTYALGGIAPFDDTVGKLMVGSLDSIGLQPPGFWIFTLDGGRLEPDATAPILRGVASLRVANGTQRSPRLQGDVVLSAGTNCRLDVILVDGQDPGIVVSFIDGEGTVSPCVCTDDVSNPVAIARINGIASASGEFTILGSDCIKVQPIAGGIQLIDLCSQPCCGCPELERLTQDLERLDSERATAQDFIARLQTSVDTMDQIVLGARLSDRSCFAGS